MRRHDLHSVIPNNTAAGYLKKALAASDRSWLAAADQFDRVGQQRIGGGIAVNYGATLLAVATVSGNHVERVRRLRRYR